MINAHAPQIVEPPLAISIMAIAAHPDDIESWCAGTLALAIDRGATVRLLLVTSGDKGSRNSTLTPAEVAAMREGETLIAAERLGIAEVIFLRHADGEVVNVMELRREIVEWIRRWRPEIVFTHDPEHPDPPYTFHRDHRAVGRAALDAIYPDARDRLSFPEQIRSGLDVHNVAEAWLFASTAADACVDIADGFTRKINARLAHESQTPDPTALEPGWRERARRIGAVAGVELAEVFAVIRLS